jgi:hypothetical protein
MSFSTNVAPGGLVQHNHETSRASSFGRYPCANAMCAAQRFALTLSGRQMGSRRRSVSSAPSVRGLSNFRYLFLRPRGCPTASGPRICAEFGFVGRDVEGPGDRLRKGKDPCTKETLSSCDWLFQQPPSALFLRPQRSAALTEQDRL